MSPAEQMAKRQDAALSTRWRELAQKIHDAGLRAEFNELLLIERYPCKAYENLQKSAQK